MVDVNSILASDKPKVNVTIRMYRQGLGDCFLLSFPTSVPKRSFYMMVDCGVVMGHKKGRNGVVSPSFKQIAEDIRRTTDGTIDLLVVTHAHYDHLSGFADPAANAIFRTMKFKDIWFGWTENPDDPDATTLKDKLRKTRDGLRLAITRAEFDVAQPIFAVLDFMGPMDTKVGSTENAMNAVRALTAQRKPRYLDASELNAPLSLPDVPGVRVYVLGPPRGRSNIQNLDPATGVTSPSRSEPVSQEGRLTRTRAFLLAVQKASGAKMGAKEKELLDQSFRLREDLRLPRKQAEKDAFFKSRYFAARDDAWRRIGNDWLRTGADLALKLDNYVNNTSLALAIEVTHSGKVLLLAADAQLGNWLSWGDLEWTVNNNADGTEKKIKITDLLERTVLYKVGHHGSSTGTFEPYLKQMPSPELVSMLPIDELDAHAMGWANMPSLRLLTQLSSGDNGQSTRVIIRTDELPTRKPNDMKTADWTTFQSRFEENELYAQYTITDELNSKVPQAARRRRGGSTGPPKPI